MSAVSPTCSLYCPEEAGDLVSLGADVCFNGIESFDSSSIAAAADDDEGVQNYIVNSFNSEGEQMQGYDELLAKYLRLPEIATARQEAINWILKVHSHYRFRPETASIAVNYFDRFLLSHHLLLGKRWHSQLLSVACLSLAAKMEETSVLLLLDLQIIEPRFLFKPKTVQRMEILVMTCLKWRLHTITPFNFLHYFISKISCLRPQSNGFSCVLSQASDLTISSIKVIDFLEYSPSTVAAAVALCVTKQPVDDQKLGCLHKRLNKDMVMRCFKLVKRNMPRLPHIKQQKQERKPSIGNKLGLAFLGSCDDHLKTSIRDTESSQDLLTNTC